MIVIERFPQFRVHATDVRSWVIKVRDDNGREWAINGCNLGEDPDWSTIDPRLGRMYRKPWAQYNDPDMPFLSPEHWEKTA